MADPDQLAKVMLCSRTSERPFTLALPIHRRLIVQKAASLRSTIPANALPSRVTMLEANQHR